MDLGGGRVNCYSFLGPDGTMIVGTREVRRVVSVPFDKNDLEAMISQIALTNMSVEAVELAANTGFETAPKEIKREVELQ